MNQDIVVRQGVVLCMSRLPGSISNHSRIHALRPIQKKRTGQPWHKAGHDSSGWPIDVMVAEAEHAA
jgi:hypothetical protein